MAESDGWRVALLDPGDFTPAYDLALARGLLAGGHEVRLVGKAGFDEAARPPFRHERFYRPLAHPLARRLPRPLARVLKGALHGLDTARLLGWLDGFAPDVVHSQWLPLPLVDRLLLPGLRRRAPLVLTLHDSNPYNGATGLVMRLGYMGVIRAADAVIVHTAQAETRLAEAGVATDRVHRLPHGLLHAAGSPSPDRRRPRADGKLRLLQFGKIRPYKGVDVLLDALARLSPGQRAKLHVEVVGQPYLDPEPYRAFVREHGLGGTVEFRFGFVGEAELDRLFAEADAALFPYREIDASGVAMTAVAHGLPVLASAIGGFIEQFEDGREARLVPPGDAGALAEVLAEWAAAPEVLGRMADAMRVTRARVPAWAEIGRRTIEVYAAARQRWLAERDRNVRSNQRWTPGQSLP